MHTGNGATKLDNSSRTSPKQDARTPLLQRGHERNESNRSSQRSSQDVSYASSFFEQVAEGIQERDREKLQREVVRYFSFFWAILSCLCAGSITAYSLYGHLFQSRLHYSQYQVNIVSITAELAMYLPVPIFGYLCDRYGPGLCSGLAGVVFGFGYILAAFTYQSGPPTTGGWPFGVMVLSFVGIGMGTSCMYLSAVTTCAKNFGRGKHKGLALAVPIASFGLSGMWQSLVGSHLLYERRPDGSKGDVDVFLFFLFLGATLLGVGLIGSVTLRIIDEGEMIDEAVDELERSGILEEHEFFGRAADMHGYGTMPVEDLSASQFSFIRNEAEALKMKAEEDRRKKEWLLNGETRRFLADRTMWWLAAGFFFVTGPGEAFINNMGTLIGTLYPPGTPASDMTSAASHVSIVAVTSTATRLLTGTASDLLAPTSPSNPHRRGPDSLSGSLESLQAPSTKRRCSVSRLTFLLIFSLILSIGQLLQASGAIQNRGNLFAIVSAFVGAGYGAVFSLIPIIISVVWGVENFGTNWGIVAMMPAAGAAVWGAIYATVYSHASRQMPHVPEGGGEMCYGKECYEVTFWAMAASVWVACGLWLWAWKGKGGWASRGTAV